MSPSALGKLAGYTERQVQKWCAMGLPCRKVPRGKRIDTLIDRDAGLAWIKGNATGIPGAHGGKRVGSGRRAGALRSAQRAVRQPEPSPAEAATSPSPRPGEGAPPRRLVPPRTLEAASFKITPGAVEPGEPDDEAEGPYVPPTPAALRKLTAIEVKQHLDIEKILSERVARGEKEGTLIAVGDARKEWTDACTAAARVLQKLRDSLASRIVTDLGLASDKAPRLRQVIEQETSHVLRAMRTKTFGPDDEEAD